jgi:hypothetical protein
MEFAKDLLAGLRHRLDAGSDVVSATSCDWHGLSARLQAAHAARIELHRLADAGASAPRGSFVEAAGWAGSLSQHDSRHVNRSALGDGKAPDGIATGTRADWLGHGRG